MNKKEILIEGKPKLFYKDGIEYPVYVVLINGVKKYIRREDGMYGRPYWTEVLHIKKYWQSVNHFNIYPFEANIGDTKEEAIHFLKNKSTIISLKIK